MTASTTDNARPRKRTRKERLEKLRAFNAARHREQRAMLNSPPKRSDEEIAAWLGDLRRLQGAADRARHAHLTFGTHATKAALEEAAQAVLEHRRVGGI